jgi:hypothetical protein
MLRALLNTVAQVGPQQINTNLLPMTRFVASTFAAAAASAMVAALAPGQAHALTVCTPVFTPPNVAPGSPISANLGTASPCPHPTVTVSLNTVGNGLASDVGVVYSTDYITGLGTDNFTRTSTTSIAIGALAETTSGPTTQAFTVSYSQPFVDPYLFFSWTDNFSVFKFYNPFTLLQSNGASSSGSEVTPSGSNDQDSGFVVQLTGTYSNINFDYINYSQDNSVSVFTTGSSLVVPPPSVPGPLPVAGLGFAYSMSRKLRRRIVH